MLRLRFLCSHRHHLTMHNESRDSIEAAGDSWLKCNFSASDFQRLALACLPEYLCARTLHPGLHLPRSQLACPIACCALGKDAGKCLRESTFLGARFPYPSFTPRGSQRRLMENNAELTVKAEARFPRFDVLPEIPVQKIL